jgi:DNA-binding MarR family transcriptional regulator
MPAGTPSPPEQQAASATAQTDEYSTLCLRDPRSILDLVNYRLYLVGAMNSSIVTRACETEFGITRREWRVLALLAALGPQPPSALAEAALLDRSRTSKALMALITKGLVERRAVASDRRWAKVELSVKGRDLYDRIFPRVREINLDLLETLTDQECAQLAAVLMKLQTRALQIHSRESTPSSTSRRKGGSLRAWASTSKG